MAGFYSARSGTIPPLPWTNFAPPLSIVFVVNGLFGIVLFIATSSFLAPLIVLPIHFIGLYLCQRDVHIVRVVQVFLSMRRAIRNRRFWRAGSYSP